MRENKKKIIVSVVGILLLIVLMVGLSYAMFVFKGTGSKENLITSGVLSINYEENSMISLTNQYPMSDAMGINSVEEGTTMNFDVIADIRGTATINYVIALDAVTEGTTLTDDYIKIYLTKNDAIASGFTEGVGTKVSDLKNNFVQDRIENYAVLIDSFSGSGSHHYKLKAWVSEDYNLPTTDTTSGNTQSNETSSESFSFKIKVIAIDQSLTILNDVIPPEIESIEITKINETTMNSKINKGIRFMANEELAISYDTITQPLIKDDKIRIAVTYSEKISGESPSLNLKFGSNNAIGTVTSGVIDNLDNTKINYEYQVQANDNGKVDVSLSGGAIKDLASNTASLTVKNEIKAEVANIKADTIAPVCSFGAPASDVIVTSGTTTYELTCTDANEFSSSNITTSDFNITGDIAVTNIVKETVTNGYKYTITVTGGSTAGSANIQLKAGIVKDSGNNNIASSSSTLTVLTQTVYTYSYSGSYQTFTVPVTGYYKLEVYGAQGGTNGGYTGGKGGYATGSISLTANATINIYVGGVGSCSAGGYNGGGTTGYDNGTACGGGGATHIASVTGLLSTVGYASAVTNGNVYIIAAGGGGGAKSDIYSQGGYGGYGGGTTGGDGSCVGSSDTYYARGQGATASAGGYYNGSFGLGGKGGGGGLYGGGGNVGHNCGAGGGSSYIGGVISGSTINGGSSMPTQDGTSTMTGNTGNGYAKITWIGTTLE